MQVKKPQGHTQVGVGRSYSWIRVYRRHTKP